MNTVSSQDKQIVTKLALETLRKVTGLGENTLRESTTFEEISLESLAITAFVSSLESHFPGLSKTFIFDCRNILDVSAYLMRQHPEDVAKLTASQIPQAKQPMQEVEADASTNAEDTEWPEITISLTMSESVQQDAIAIVGMHGRFPGADSLDEFWNNLYEGRHAISEIPQDRWPLDGFFEEGTDSRKTGLSYAKWGGFINEVDKFDAQFFGISSREADQMDPQERIFLECAWHAMEDASLFGERAENLRDGNNYNIGVFVGLTTNTYSLLTADNWRNGKADIPAAVPWSAANRVSFALNLSGPSLAVDTACSSSLVALHLACESLRKGECKAAIAGGVNLYFHPAKYIQLCQLQMLSPTGRCHTFGKDGDGFVPGEGVGAVILKPLSAAQADGDRILGVIRGTSVNHCGRTNGYTVPNAQSQAQLIDTALGTFALPPSSISYVEAHGTGTKLGDPIEFTALTETLAGRTSAVPCGMGSVKSNIGHLESAAGIVGVIKVLLQLEHKQIAPSLWSSELNPALDMQDSRFFVPQTAMPWQPDPDSGLRRAGISSFGAGGTNGHVIIEEASTHVPQFQPSAGHLAFPVSARSQEQLHEQLLNLLKFVESEQFGRQSHGLHSLAYILQCGRRHHPFRFIAIASTAEELANNIAKYLQDVSFEFPTIFTSHVRPDEEMGPEEMPQDVTAMAKMWSAGVRVLWRTLWEAAPPLVQIPLYPFARERHWISIGPETLTMPANNGRQPAAAQTQLSFTFTGQEYFLRDHQIGGKPIFPAAAYFDCFYSAARSHGLGERLEFRNISWTNPFRPDGAAASTLACSVTREDAGLALEFSAPDRSRVYCRASVQQRPAHADQHISLADVRARCISALNAQACYPLFDSLGMVYGPSFRGMHNAWVSHDLNEALVEVSRVVPQHTGLLEPGMLDSIFQSSFVLSLAAAQPVQNQFIPYSVKSMRVHERLEERVLVHVKRRPQQDKLWSMFDYAVYAPTGDLVLQIDEFRFRNLARVDEPSTATHEHKVHLLKPIWEQTELANTSRGAGLRKTLVFDRTPDLYQALCSGNRDYKSMLWLVISGEQFLIREGNIVELDYRKADHLNLLWRMFNAEGGLPESMVFNLENRGQQRRDIPSWETHAGLSISKDIIEIIRNVCKFSFSPRFHIQVLCSTESDSGTYASEIAGFLRAVNQEIPTLTASVISGTAPDFTPSMLIEELHAEHAGVHEIRWDGGKRLARRLIPHHVSETASPVQFGSDDVVVITGGAGALARILAGYLASTKGIRLALIGRSKVNHSITELMEKLRNQGAEIDYWQADCADREQLAHALTLIREQMGPVNGVLHCAGVLKDAFFLRQEQADWDNILKAKVLGAVWLDELTAQDPIKWFGLCSGLAGVRGNIGQSTYGLANAWLNAFAERRQQRVASGQRSGITTAIAWSLWDTESGMRPPQNIIDRYVQKGLVPLSEEDGIAVFRQVLEAPQSVIVPVKGRTQAIEEFLDVSLDQFRLPEHQPVAAQAAAPGTPAASLQETTAQSGQRPAASLEERMIGYLTQHLSRVTRTPVSKINSDVSLEAFGLDSILVMELNDLLEKDFPQMPKTVLFEARNLRLLARLLIAEHAADAEKVAQALAQETTATQAPAPLASAQQAPVTTTGGSTPEPVAEISPTAAPSRNTSGDNIAIVGIAGRYPGANDLHELWRHLLAGHDLVTEIPGRWSMETVGSETNPVYAKWGGFINDFDRFDPLFFGISPRDAERMDPQERLFLQTAWHTLEDAGYTPESLSGERDGSGKRKRVGVIVGVMYGEYQLYGADAKDTITNSSYSSIANRVSYCLDFDGPSFAIDSMCSSSLTSVSLACDQLRSRRCDAVIAGGVNLSIHPHKYRMLCELNFASTDGRCRSFGEGGDGYVPGEGVGAVLLKRLEDAERDGDHIYAVIQGSDLGHGAKTSGYTVPNADAQAEVIRNAFERSGVDVSRLSYLEAHGTGTSLGDPIEIRGMSKALVPLFEDGQQCAVGSIKSNIGHLESAAGIAALSKVVLQLQHQKLVPSIHSETLNGNIDFSKTPFHIQRELGDWQGSSPRVAAVSSFGAGGANAHIVLEEYVHVPQQAAVPGKEVFLFSARSYQQLGEMVQRFIAYLDREMVLSADGVSYQVTRYGYTLRDVAMTLAEGRRHCRTRLAIPAASFSGLRQALQQFITTCGNEDPALHAATLESREIFYGDAEQGQAETGLSREDQLQAYAHAWTQGADQERPHTADPWHKVPLPGYAFLRNRYWVAHSETKPAIQFAQPVKSRETVSLNQVKALAQQPAVNSEHTVTLLTPNAILDRVAQGVMSHEEARSYLLAMTKVANTTETTH